MIRILHWHWLPLAVGLLLSACSGQAGDPARGRELYQQPNLGARQAPGCITCHSLEPGEVKVGPSHAGVGRRATDYVSDSSYQGQATDASGYLRESILDPNAHVVAGFQPGIMYQQYDEVLTEQQLEDLVAFLLSLQ